MAKLKTPVVLSTAFADYSLTDLIGEGGAGRVYGATDERGAPVAVKLLTNASSDKRRRFKNEIAFLSRNQHANIVTVTDHGVASAGPITGPFYVMRRFTGNLRQLMERGLPQGRPLRLFSQVLDGVEAAHMLGVTHRDLKPENVLHDESGDQLAVADFGVASFTEDQLATLVETGAGQRLANFQYAAPEQRTRGRTVMQSADVYALGLILNELFTGEVPHGTDFKTIASVDPDFGFLDAVVLQMIKQSHTERPQNIQGVKALIERHGSEALSRQKLSRINNTVIKAEEIDEPLANDPPILVGAEWKGNVLRLTLDRPVNHEWIQSLQNMGSYSCVMGIEPHSFAFNGQYVTVSVMEHSVQQVINYFKAWLPNATNVLRQRLEQNSRRQESERRDQLRRERDAEERNLRVNQSLRI
ncbi:MAG TPA: serine/threonine-protein kinase [Caulobacteraceae bacterium]|jgi:serine/threonine protein kinase|nr:serine/threonine-protein kinase [Caulobacteraceae bacterium]